MILLDTHPLVWFAQGEGPLGKRALQVIQSHAARNDILVSPISFWEVGMLVSKGRLDIGVTVREWTHAVLRTNEVELADFTASIAVDAGTLPGDIHGDPGDRIIVATARSLGCPLLTKDRKILAYAAAGYLKAVDARL